MPVRERMLTDDILALSVNTAIVDARKAMTNSRHRFFPVINENGTLLVLSGPGL